MKKQEDWLAGPEAATLARSIHDYWRARGYDVRVWAEPATWQPSRGDERKSKVNFQIRSDLLNGLPRLGVKNANLVEVV